MEDSRIGWTKDTWNPWQGCHKVSPGCAHCYMFRWQARYGKAQDVVLRSARRTFQAPLRWHKARGAGDAPVLVFTCSLSDFFIEEADPWRAEAWAIIRATPGLTYQILTKRPERILACLPPDWGRGYPNVWLGVSVENQRWLPRLATLSQVPALVHFASFEPLLGALGDLTPSLPWLEWAIVGGESGEDRRPMELAWLLDVVAQCQRAGLPCFVKQDSAFKEGQQGRIPDAVWAIKAFPLVLAATA
jgi:protein gp37